LNPNDYTSLRLAKTSIGPYLYLGSASTAPDDEGLLEVPPLTWQTATVLSPAIPAGKFMCGDFARGTILFEGESMTVQMAFQNEDDFVRHLVTLRAELRSALAVPIPAALLQGTLPAGSLAPQAGNGPQHVKN
jgi:HK97 family phage major capsid protein